ncbi:hypothetical protein [Skermania piniformis]|uniref:Uncharacterized protein n=1 Tax=Skermania pinensis TaxID=39122 RepID=A0ABX8S935_9ACTN|nr:hypothetical protein [Skermania piniformis]QXQ14378.1 hypothetical protein KV203_02855 [Skermania piniformis]
MTDERAPDSTSQISVAELLARNGKSSATGNGRRRRGGARSIPVAELTGELPVVDTAGTRSANQPLPGDYSRVELTEIPRARFAEPIAPDPPRPDTRNVPTAAWSVDQAPGNAGTTNGSKTNGSAANGSATGGSATDGSSSGAASTGHARRVSGTDISGNDIETVQFPAITGRSDERTAWQVGSRASGAVAPAEPVQPAPSPAGPRRSEPADRSKRTDRSKRINRSTPDPAAAGGESTRRSARRAASPLRQWLVLAAQVIVAVIVGALQFKGFEELWDTLPVVALVLAVLVVIALVALVRVVRRTDDLLSTVIAIVVGICVTIGPLVFLLSSG